MKLDTFLVDVYNVFDNDIDNVDLLTRELLYGGVVSYSLPTRGQLKCIKVKKFNIELSAEDLPDLKYSPRDIYSNEGKWFYMDKGNYHILAGIKSQYDYVKHLEGIEIYAENILRLRVVFELLKTNVDLGTTNLTTEEYLDIGFMVLKSDPTMVRFDDEMIRNSVSNWLPIILAMPLYSKIPIDIRGRKLS
ncbi:hypothetical protein FAZ19_18395 [Sphingobacterium alkalisoli]|uniref:Uncharacterized protein n=1 Tax=Sphingobacterium alkalisoli TaxID=1874115 RepID=A0A4U0GWX5_9SPHI|nr:hypothetical protein [Sphingobacterium alkalisoli]TJY63548.1 hypothetical protein FAZ19_18395 [Sphingobacterium alkalisoli]